MCTFSRVSLCCAGVAALLLTTTACSTGRPTAEIEAEAKTELVANRAAEIASCEFLGTAARPLEGSITLINFWGWWCPPCIAEMPLLKSFHDEHTGSATIQIVGITALLADADPDEERRRIEKAVADNDLEFPVAICGPAVRDYKIERWPTTVLIDQAGLIVDYAIGEEGTRRLMAEAEKLASGN